MSMQTSSGIMRGAATQRSLIPNAALVSRQAPATLRQAPCRLGKRTMTTAAAPASPEPASPWYEDHVGQAVLEREQVATVPSVAAARRFKDPNQGYNWLTHPCPHNPFRSLRDEDAWYVEPSMEQRVMAQDLGLPLYGIC